MGRRIETYPFRTTGGLTLTAARFNPDAAHPRGTVFIPPLIGGSFLMYARQFSFLTEAGYRVVSFNYRGHQASEGCFDVTTACQDAAAIACALREESPTAPLIGIGTCFGSMPIFKALEDHPTLFDGVVFINAIAHLRQTATPLEALRLYLRHQGWRLPRSLGQAVHSVLGPLFPTIDQSDAHFGILSYEQVRVARVAREYLLGRTPRPGPALSTPTLCCYGEHDALLGLQDTDACATYRASFERVFQDVDCMAFEADHYMDGHLEVVAERVVTFCNNQSKGDHGWPLNEHVLQRVP